jgi:hypothetical protein
VTLAELHNRGRGVESETPVEQRSWHVTEWQASRVVRWTAYGSEAEASKPSGWSSRGVREPRPRALDLLGLGTRRLQPG